MIIKLIVLRCKIVLIYHYRFALIRPSFSFFRIMICITCKVNQDELPFLFYNITARMNRVYCNEFFPLYIKLYYKNFYNGFAQRARTKSTSVASFLVLGGGGKTPKCTDKKVTYMCERAKRASTSETYIFRSQNTSARTQCSSILSLMA